MNKKLWLKAVNGEVVVNCSSKKECDDYLHMCSKKKMTIDDAVRDNAWKNYGQNVCFNISHNDMYFGGLQYFKESGSEVITYTELMEDKKTLTGPELAQAILDGKFKEGTKLKSEYGFVYTLKKYEEGDLGLYYSHENIWATSIEIINRIFTLIEEPKPELFYFNQIKSNGKKIRLKGWDKFYTLQEALKILTDYDSVFINEAFNKKVWEVEE